ncbi:MAG: CinA family protein, partial [Bacillota bacterium]
RKLLEREGAVSEAAARAMALAVRQLFNTDIGIGITGVAGPASDAGGRPIGLVYVALAGAAEELCRETRFVGTRKTVKTRAAQTALTMLWRVMAAEAK